jgi:predicted metal-dependent peptidase
MTIALDWEKLYAARLYAAQVRPYLAAALFALHPVESPRVLTMSVDRHWRCYVSPAFVDRTPLEELAGVWVHEVSHLLRDHHGRGDRFAVAHGLDGCGERLRMNIAADCEINDDVYGDGLPRPRDAVEPRHLRLEDGRLMEDYLLEFSLGPYTLEFSWLDCGSGADGLEREWLGAAVRAASTGPGAGEDYSYGRPSRRATSLPGVVLPSLRRSPPKVCVIIDTSRSVSDAELGSAILEVAAIGKSVGGRRDLVRVLACDAAAGVAQPLCQAEGIQLIGGGGTDMREGFARALRGNPRPDVIVVLTDGQTPWPSRKPPCRTVIGLFRRRSPASRYDEPPPDWARVVDIG